VSGFGNDLFVDGHFEIEPRSWGHSPWWILVFCPLFHHLGGRWDLGGNDIFTYFPTKLVQRRMKMSESPKITRDELESKFRALQADIQGRAADKKQSVIAIGSAVATVIVLVAYLMGRRSGRRRATRLNIRRF
jgi:hypothetical protein